MASFPGVISKNPSKYFYPLQILQPAARTSTATGTAVDRARNQGYASLTLMVSPGAWTDGTHNFIIEESDDNSTWGTVAAADLLGASAFTSITSSGTATVQRIDYIGRSRYVRVRTTTSGTTTGAVYGVLGLLFAPNIFPAA